ncbi:RHS repeat-associated core domain-containing protein, partial [Kitasatospora cineracea]|uniref:RHS repeat-associated core domain-containing protein n=1 Tax=Kitasatospora cineracea TaxID=88074 RepID=UPI0036D96E83
YGDDADQHPPTTTQRQTSLFHFNTTYDNAGRISGIASTKGTTTLASWQIHRDNAGQPRSVDINRLNLTAGTENFTYDDAGRLTSGCPVTPNFTGCTAGTLTYTYDKVGNRLTQTDAYGTTTYTYDDADQLTSSKGNSVTTTYTYDNDGRTTSVTLPYRNRTIASGTTLASGTVTASNNARLIMQADGNLVLYQIDTGRPVWSSDTSGHPGATATMQTDGNLAVTDTTGTVLWSSNTAGNTGAIAKVQDDGNFVLYNTAGTALWSSKTYRAALSNYATTYTYDAAGNATTVVGKQTYTFTYDANGNRVTTKTDGALSNTLTWDINNPLPQIATETNGTGSLIGDYTYDPLGLPQSQHNPSGTYYQHHDWVGSITDLTKSDGTQQLRTGYDPFGQSGTTTTATNAPATPFGFAGQYNDPVIPGKQYLRAREYNTATGRFNSRDPLSAPASSPYGSAYSYAADAPTIYTDPSGMAPQTDDPSHMSNLEAIGNGLVTGAKMPFEFIGDAYNALSGNNGGAGAFADKYFPVRPAYQYYVAAAKLREFGCNNVADLVDKHADEFVQQVAIAGLGGLGRWFSAKSIPISTGMLREASPILRLTYMVQDGKGLPGRSGVELPGRPTVAELERLTVKHGVEFAVIYKLGPGPKGAGGTYSLYSGVDNKVAIPVGADKILVYHTHPNGATSPSPADRAVLQAYIDSGSPMRSSKIIPVGGDELVSQFTVDGIDPHPGARTWSMNGGTYYQP